MTHDHCIELFVKMFCDGLCQLKCSTIENVLCGPRRPSSPTLSAQEGELDNLLNEPSGAWDEDPLEPRHRPRSIKYGKEAMMTVRPTSKTGSEAGERSDVTDTTKKGEPTWTAGKSLEELEREEADLARMDLPGPPMDEFGEFEQGVQPVKGDQDDTQR
jgi:hypothetical protein